MVTIWNLKEKSVLFLLLQPFIFLSLSSFFYILPFYMACRRPKRVAKSRWIEFFRTVFINPYLYKIIFYEFSNRATNSTELPKPSVQDVTMMPTSARKWNYYACTITNHAMKWLSRSHYTIKKSALSRPFNHRFGTYSFTSVQYRTSYCDIDCCIRNLHSLLDAMITAKSFYTSQTTTP